MPQNRCKVSIKYLNYIQMDRNVFKIHIGEYGKNVHEEIYKPCYCQKYGFANIKKALSYL
jgi:hypothetical protein